MKRFFVKTFIENWPRKLFSLILAIILYFTISQSMTTTRTISSIPVRIVNLPIGKTVEGIDSSGIMKKRVALTLTGNRHLIEHINPHDLEVEIDATGKPDEWVAETSRKNLVSLNPDFSISRALKKVSSKSIVVRTVKLVREQVPVFITAPIGQAPKGYDYKDMWPYRFTTTISGPEERVRKAKQHGLKLTLNLNNITRRDLDKLVPSQNKNDADVISFLVPDSWKQISVPKLSEHPITIDDPNIHNLRIDFLRRDTLSINRPIPISLFFPLKDRSHTPHKIALGPANLVKSNHGMKTLIPPLYVRGVSSTFLEVVKDNIEIVITVDPKNGEQRLDWSVQFINPKLLEDRYVAIVLQDVSTEDLEKLSKDLREEYIRNRFRNFMHRFTLFNTDFERLDLSPTLEGNTIAINPGTLHAS